MEAMIRHLREGGRHVASLKHHGHSEADPMRTGDSGKHFAAGSSVTSVVSPLFSHSSYYEEPPLAAYLAFYHEIPQLDWLLIEGYKEADLPKIVILSTASDWQDLRTLSNIKAVVTEHPSVVEDLKHTSLPHFRRQEFEQLGTFIMKHEGRWTEANEF